MCVFIAPGDLLIIFYVCVYSRINYGISPVFIGGGAMRPPDDFFGGGGGRGRGEGNNPNNFIGLRVTPATRSGNRADIDLRYVTRIIPTGAQSLNLQAEMVFRASYFSTWYYDRNYCEDNGGKQN